MRSPFILNANIIVLSICLTSCGPQEKQLKEEAERKAKPVTESETLLVCEGEMQSAFAGRGGKVRQTFVITKNGDKVTKVKTEDLTYTLDRIDVSPRESMGSVYIQLIAESDKLVLRTEITKGKENHDTVLFNTGAYKKDRGLFEWGGGQCTVGKKAF